MQVAAIAPQHPFTRAVYIDMQRRAATRSIRGLQRMPHFPASVRKSRPSTGVVVAGITATAMAATAAWVAIKARKAEKKYPRRGGFITVDGVRLHYLEQGH